MAALPAFNRVGRVALWIFFGLLAYMPLHIFVSTWFGTTFGLLEFAKVFKDIVLVGGFALALIASAREAWFKPLLKDRLIWLIAAYSLLTLFIAAIKPTDADAEILGVVYNLRFLLFFIYGLLLTHMYKPDWLQKNALKVVMAVAVLVLGFGVIQYTLLPDNALGSVGYSRANGVLPAFYIDDKPDLERIMSTLRDPNSFGSYVIIIFSIALAYLLTTKNRELKKMAGGIVALSLLCLLFTFSRSAWIGAVVTAAVLLGLFYKHKKQIKVGKKLIASVAIALLVLIGGLYAARDTYFVQNVILHADESTVLEDPNQLRIRFWQESLEAAGDNPLGYGPGTAGLASIRNDVQGTVLNENYYFQILHEVGVIGLALFLAILALVTIRLYGLAKDNPLALALLASFAGLAVTNFLVHIWANEAVAYTWWGLAGLCCITDDYNYINDT